MAAGSQANDPSDSAGASMGSSAKLFLGGLSWETDEDKLRVYFSKFGSVEDVVVMRDRTTRNPRGFGFITFQSEEAASLACKEAHFIDGRTIDAKPSVPQGEGSRPRSKKVFVGGLSADTTEEEFQEYFSKFGAVVEATIMVDHTNNRSRGFGFVTFEDEASVHDIFRTGSMHMVGGKQVEVKSATPKGSGPITAQQPRGGSGFGRNSGGYSAQQRSNGGMGNSATGRSYDGTFGQQGYSMAAFGVNMAGQYGQYGYGMPAYGGYPGMMVGYGGYGGFSQYGQFGQHQQHQQHQHQHQHQQHQHQHQQQQQLQQQDGRRGGGSYSNRKQQHPPVMQMQTLAIQGQSH